DAFIDHGAAQALAYGSAMIQANGSNTLNGDITVEGNASTASASGLASGYANLLVRTILGNNNINGGLSVSADLVTGGAGSTAGFARLELDAAGSNGSNIAGPGFAIPSATAGGASVQNVETDSASSGNALAQLIIPHVIQLANELTRRMVVTYIGVTGYVLPTGFYISDRKEPGNGTATGGNSAATLLAWHGHVGLGTYRSTLFNQSSGNGLGGFYVDENGVPVFRASMGGLPDQAELPFAEVCDLGDDNRRRVTVGGGILNCPWDDQEPTFY
ncbi:MAG TPA: hypothetical protein VJ981_09750, partial [Gammaproteobacteria bacterium]|nr:hypothetical protein [Gammaproteobacteria bacterium]